MTADDNKGKRVLCSDTMKSGPIKAAARAFLRGMGLDDDDIAQPFVGVVSTQGETTALITDGRFSGVSRDFRVGYVTPEAARGGLLALVENGDPIKIDL